MGTPSAVPRQAKRQKLQGARYVGKEGLKHGEKRALTWKRKQIRRNKWRRKSWEETSREEGVKESDREIVETRIKKARKTLRKSKDDERKQKRIQQKIRKLLSKLEYINQFPTGERYISLFDHPKESKGANVEKDERRMEIQDDIDKGLVSLCDPCQPAAPDAHKGDGDEDVSRVPTDNRDEFFLYSDEDDGAMMAQAQPLTFEDVQGKAVKRGRKTTHRKSKTRVLHRRSYQ